MTADRCINPAEITPEDHLAYAEGMASSAARGHIERCAFCLHEAAAYASMGRTVSRGLFRRSCPPSLTIGEYALGILEPVRMQEVASHLLDCPHCLAESRSFAGFLALPDDDLEPDRGLLGTLRRIFATPQAPLPSLAALRGAGAPSATYVAEDMTLTIELQATTPGRPGRVVAGLLQRTSTEPARAQLFAGDDLIEAQDVDEFGSFFFGAVTSGSYRVEVSLSDAVIVVDPVVVP